MVAIWVGLGYYGVTGMGPDQGAKVAKLKMSNIRMIDTDVGVSLRKDSNVEVEMDDVVMTRGRTLFEERDAPSLAQSLGLPEDTPAGEVVSVIRALQVIPNERTTERLEVLKGSRIWTYIERSANAATVIEGLFAVAAYAATIG